MDTARIHILVVDDFPDVADSTAELLTLWGYDATPCYCGATALAATRVRRPAAVLLDLLMSQMDGFQFAQAFRRLPRCRSVPLIAVSGYTSPACAAQVRTAGIDHYLLKPAAPDELRALLVVVTEPSGPRRPAPVRTVVGLGELVL